MSKVFRAQNWNDEDASVMGHNTSMKAALLSSRTCADLNKTCVN